MSDDGCLIEVKKYTKKPVTVSAYQTDKQFEIETPEGVMTASVGDFIITGVQGEQYPCKPDIFFATYDIADSSIDDQVMDNLTEWSMLVTELSEKEPELNKLKEDYSNEEFKIVFQSDIDFKGLYGSTSEKVRKQHASIELKSLNDNIKDLELSIEHIKRRISFLKQLIHTKTVLLEIKE